MNMSAPPRLTPTSNSETEVALKGTDAEHEEAAKADRQQDDAGLIAGPTQADDRVAQRKPRGRRAGRRRARARTPRRRARLTTAANPVVTATPPPGPRLPRRHRDERRRRPRPRSRPGASRLPARDAPARTRRGPAAARSTATVDRRVGAANEQQRLDPAHLQERHQREQERDQEPDGQPCAAAECLRPYDEPAERRGQRRPESPHRDRRDGRRRCRLPPARAARPAACTSRAPARSTPRRT